MVIGNSVNTDSLRAICMPFDSPPPGAFSFIVHFISFTIMGFINDSTADMTGSAGLSVDITNPVHAAYAGAAVIGATAVVGSVAVTTIAAPGLVLVPAAIAGGLVATGHFIAGNNAIDADVSITSTPVSA